MARFAQAKEIISQDIDAINLKAITTEATLTQD